jgi:tetratricopeptide (TPR) repeat protein
VSIVTLSGATKILIGIGLMGLMTWQVGRNPSLDEARAAYRRRDVMVALRHAMDALDRRPKHGGAARIAGLCLSQLDFAGRAEAFYEKAQRSGPLETGDLLIRALGLARASSAEDRLKAERVYEEILARDPGNPTALRQVAAIHHFRGRDDKALELAERLARTRGGAEAGFEFIATLHHLEGHHIPAAEAYRKVLELDPELRSLTLSFSAFLSDYTTEMATTGRLAEAHAALARILARRTDLPPRDLASLQASLGLICEREGRAEEAEAAARRAIDLDPTLGEPYLLLGRMELQRRNLPEALRLLPIAVGRLPDSYDAHYNLFLAYKLLGRDEEAEQSRLEYERLRREHYETTPNRGMGAMPKQSP